MTMQQGGSLKTSFVLVGGRFSVLIDSKSEALLIHTSRNYCESNKLN
ncbi:MULTISPECIES: hypothetical protein [Nostocaceae]|nr:MULTISPECIES: hypothetical protein [Nostocaceae]